MAFTLTSAADAARNQINIKPRLVLEIDGITTIFGAGSISRYIRIGDDDLYVGNDWVIGGSTAIEDQLDYVSLDGTTTTINQQLNQDKGGTTSVSSVAITLIDVNDEITDLITPGSQVADILGRKARVYLGFEGTSYPEDYVQVFSGVIDDIQSDSKIILNVAHPEQKKRLEILPKVQSKLNGAITNASASIVLENSYGLADPLSGDDTLACCIKIEDEIVRYEAINYTTHTLTSLTRGYLGTAAAGHDDQTDAESFYRLQGNPLELALYLMMGGWPDTNYLTGITVGAFLEIPSIGTVPNAISFPGIDVTARYGINTGDFVTTTGASEAANNVTLAPIAEVVVLEDGSYVILDESVTLTSESPTSALLAIRSKYQVLNEGLKMGGDEVDTAEFERINELATGVPDFDVYVWDTLTGNEFIDKELLFPSGCFSLPRKGKVSCGISGPPLAVADLSILDEDNVTNPGKIRVRRTIGKYFYNGIAIKFDESLAESGKLLAGYLTIDEDSKDRIVVGSKLMTIEARGMRQSDATTTYLRIMSSRLLDRYKFAAEEIKVSLFYGVGFNIEIGDVVLFGSPELKISDTKFGDRDFRPRVFEVINKSINIKTGQIDLTLLDTNYTLDGRYGVVSPASQLSSGSTTTRLVLKDSYGTVPPKLEKAKWEAYVGERVTIHDTDWTFEYERTLIGFDQADPYVMIVDPALPISPSEDTIVDIPIYPAGTDPEDDAVYKAVHVYTMPSIDVVSGASTTEFDVGASDAAKFSVGQKILRRDSDWGAISDEVEVTDVTGTTITVSPALDDTPAAGDKIELVGFLDGGGSYRYF